LGTSRRFSDRMTRQWRLFGSADGKTWLKLDERTDVRPWDKGETRTYELAQTARFRQYRLVVLAGWEPILRVYEFRLE